MFQAIEYTEQAGRPRRAVELERRLAVARQLNEARGGQSHQRTRPLAWIGERAMALVQSGRRWRSGECPREVRYTLPEPVTK